jgi:hypothetical protein
MPSAAFKCSVSMSGLAYSVICVPHVRDADFEGVAAGHVVRREAKVVLVVGGGREYVRRAVQNAERRFRFRDERVRAEAVDVLRLGSEDPPLGVEREPSLEEKLVRERVVPCRLEQVLRTMREVDAPLGRIRGAALVAVHQALVDMRERRELVLLGRLVRQVQRFTARPGVAADGLVVQILGDRHERRRVVGVAV